MTSLKVLKSSHGLSGGMETKLIKLVVRGETQGFP